MANRSYPVSATLTTALAAWGIEEVAENLGSEDVSIMTEIRRMIWDIVKPLESARALAVCMPNETNNRVKVCGGYYYWGNTIKSYGGSGNLDLTDNDTSYIWMDGNNTVQSAIDATGWPTEQHIKLASVAVDSSGNITNIVDYRPIVEGNICNDYSDIITNAGAVIVHDGNVIYDR